MAEEYGYTKDYLTKDGEPWFPVMGEFDLCILDTSRGNRRSI